MDLTAKSIAKEINSFRTNDDSYLGDEKIVIMINTLVSRKCKEQREICATVHLRNAKVDDLIGDEADRIRNAQAPK